MAASRTSKRFKELCESPSLWKALCFLRWRCWNQNPHLTVALANLHWRVFFAQRHLRDVQLGRDVERLSAIRVTEERLELERQILSSGREGLEMLRAMQTDGHKHDDLTKKHFARKMCIQFSRIQCVERWRQHLALPEEDRKLEDGAIIVAQTLGYPRIDPGKIHHQLDVFAEAARRRMESAIDPTKRFELFNKYFFGELGFRGFDAEAFYPSRSFIHQVLQSRRGIQIVLCLVYCAVARRVQIPLKMVGMPRHFLARYVGEGAYKGHFVDAFGGGEIISEGELERRGFPLEFSAPSDSVEVYTRLLRNLIEEYNSSGQVDNMLNALNQSILLAPQQEELAYRAMIFANYIGDIKAAKADLDYLISLGSITANGELALWQKLSLAEERLERERTEARKGVEPKIRPHDLLYSVGHAFRHAKHGYRGVIFGWSPRCPEEARILLASGEEVAELQEDQPFYSVLVDTRDRPAQTSWVSQQNVILEPSDVIQHPDVGLYFTAFRFGNYIPNTLLRQEYPFDLFSREEVSPMSLSAPSNKRTAPTER